MFKYYLPGFNLIKRAALTACLLLLFACSEHDEHAHSNHDDNSDSFKTPNETVSDAEHHDHETHHEGDSDSGVKRAATSHAHGGAELAIAQDGSILTIELDSPLYNLLGFEHSPQDAQQQERVEVTESRLSEVQTLFEFNGESGCKAVSDRAVNLGLSEDAVDEEDDHADVVLSYEFSCDQPEELTSITVKLFDYFENLDEIDLVFLGPSIQLQKTLVANDNRAILTR